MKKIFISLLFVLPFLFSCQPQVDPFQPGEEDVAGCYGVYFPSQAATGSHTLDPTMAPEATFTAMRKNTSGAITVPLKVTASENVFDVGALSFADGQSETTFTVKFPNSEIGKSYSLSIAIEDPQYASKYLNQPIAFDYSMMRVEWNYVLNPQTGEKAKVHWVQGWWGEEVDTYVKYYEVNGIRTCFTETIPESHFYKEYYTGYGFWGVGAAEGDAEWSFIWYTKNKNDDGNQLIRIPRQKTGYYRDDYGADVYVLDYFYWDTSSDSDSEFISWAKSNSDVASYYDGNGGIYLSARSYYMFGVGGWNPGAYDTYGIAEGFNRADYTLTLSAGESDEGIIPVTMNFSTDVEEVKYAGFLGSLTPTQTENAANAIIEGTAEGIGTATYAGTAYLTFPESGAYTLVAVGFANGEAKSTASTFFNYVAAGDEEAYAVKLFGGVEDISALYEKDGFNKTNSFQFYLYGEDLTDVKVGIAKTSAVEDAGGPEAFIGSLTPVSAEALAAINGNGYTDICTGLDANMDYTLIVWGTNDFLSKIVTFEYTTEGLPSIQLGIGTYNYAGIVFDGDDPDLEYFVNPNYVDLYEITHWGYDVTFKFYWDQETNECYVPSQWTGYTHSSYGPIYILELNDYAEELAEEPSSYYDPETNTFVFNVIYYVAAGYFGYDFESFVVTAEVNGEGGDAMVEKASVSFNSLTKAPLPAKHHPLFAGIPVERELSSVSANVVEFRRSEKNTNRPLEVR